MSFKRGDVVRFLGKEACEKSIYPHALEFSVIHDELIEGDVYEVVLVNNSIINAPILLKDKYSYHPEDVFELVEPYKDPMIEYDEHDKHVVNALGSNPKREDIGTDTDDDDVYCYISSKDYKNLRVIFERDHTFYDELSELIEYLRGTYADKYEASSPNGFAPKELLTSDVCMFNVSKYLKRYTTKGFEKSGNKRDVMKSIHYLLLSLNSSK